MKNLKEKYKNLIEERAQIISEIKELEENEIVSKYLELSSRLTKIDEERIETYKKMKYQEFSSCSHITINTYIEYDSWEGRYYIYRGCIKCGLDRRILLQADNGRYVKWMPLSQQVMYNFLKEYSYHGGIDTNVTCDINLARAIYQKIKEIHPNIDDETARKYFEIALENIRSKKANKEQQEKRAKRLSLNLDFDRWGSNRIRNKRIK